MHTSRSTSGSLKLLLKPCQLVSSFGHSSSIGYCLQQVFLTPTIAHELQAEDAWQTSDVEVQASQIQAERDKADMLAKQLQACREEAAWLRNRVCQLQQNKHARDSAAARAAVLPPSHTVARQALQHCQHFHANVCPPSAAT